MKLDVETLESAVEEMGDFLEKFRDYEASDDILLFRILQAGVIKAFEFTYELSVRFIRRQLSQTSFNPVNVDAMDFRSMIRVAADAGLIAEPRRWFEYRKKRNITSHTYDRHKAEEVLSIVDDFLEDARFLLAELVRRNTP
ncbi:MAG: hypothetical protein F4X32_02580 [Candidatus Dadabacteria bacterium]|nr:HI0074 family nucleotidyltransferase substrate-binding subunit [Candidatus Dadabacteria bacterium]MXW43259.1 hypothetical protein [Candidatus Dadabacteria bacterium]MYB26373.1 hypothetical protein [Candidatus Dadabacteria bacterium]